MSCAGTYLFSITFVVIITLQLERVDAAITVSDRNRTLRNILQMKSWLPVNNDGSANISSQRLFVDGQLTTFSAILRNTQPIVNESSVNRLASVMYVALGCKCSEWIKTLLQKTIEHRRVNDLKTINTTVSKAISVLLHLTDIAPNVVRREPGVIGTFLSLNLRIDEFVRDKTVPDRPRTGNTDEIFRRTMFQTINEIERFTISNCALDGEGDSAAERTKHYHDENVVTKYNSYVNGILDETGLSTRTVLKRYETSQTNHVDFKTVIIRVAESLSPVLNVEELLLSKRIENTFIHVNLIFDSIMKIVYEFILRTLTVFERLRNEGNRRKIKSKIDDLTGTDLITVEYEELILQSILMKFPSVFINNVKLVLRIIKDLAYYGNIFDSTSIKTTIGEKLNSLRNKNRPIALLSGNNERKFIFREFLRTIVSVDELKYFNLILNVRQNDGVGRDFFDDTDLNTMRNTYHDDDDDDGKSCNRMRSFYILCFDIQTKIKNCESKAKCLRNLKTEFTKLKTRFNAISSERNENLETILRSINGYLVRNAELRYAGNEEKLNRILRFITNLIDKYQVYSCKRTLYRDSMYALLSGTGSGDTIREKYLTGDHGINVTNSPKEKNVDASGASSIDNYIDSMSHLQRLYRPKLYWRGEPKTIDEISVCIGENLLDFSTFTKFINLFHDWFTSILMYAIIDALKCFSRQTYTTDDDRALVAYVQKLPSVRFPEPYSSVIRTVGSVNSFYRPIDSVGYQILLEDHLRESNVVIEQKTRAPCDMMSAHVKRLDDIFYLMTEMYNEKNEKPRPIDKSKSNSKLEKKSKADNSIGRYVRIPNEVLSSKKPLP